MIDGCRREHLLSLVSITTLQYFQSDKRSIKRDDTNSIIAVLDIATAGMAMTLDRSAAEKSDRNATMRRV